MGLSTHPFCIFAVVPVLQSCEGLQDPNGGVTSLGQRKLLADADSRSSIEREEVPSMK